MKQVLPLNPRNQPLHWHSGEYKAVDTCTVACLVGRRGLFRTICSPFIFFLKEVLFMLLSFSHSVMSDSLQPQGLQHSRLPCPSLSPRVCSDSCPLSQWCYIIISSSAPFSFCLQSFPASGSFPINWLFTSGSQSIGASASVLPMNIQSWFPLGLVGLISLQSKGLSRVFSCTIWRHQFFNAQLSLRSNSHIHTQLLEKP